MSTELDAAAPPAFLAAHDRLLRVAAAQPELISFAGGLPDPALFPRRELTHAFITAVSAPRCVALQYGWPEGLLGLRRHVADCLARRGAPVDPDQVIITSGAQQAISLTLHAALRRGRKLGVEATCYPGAEAVALLECSISSFLS